ncbi:high-affinity cell membrane calcium channel [Phaffia rhodozyma]|uniref:Calcium-channel protein CCH1 n=1 Tax=Phaffia rhodozyma TaxID=264483 RepID=A0A0F7SVU1_PHARH|nr:high-affinity cell membrane calcium channel [Phaffia rhodozyma]
MSVSEPAELPTGLDSSPGSPSSDLRDETALPPSSEQPTRNLDIGRIESPSVDSPLSLVSDHYSASASASIPTLLGSSTSPRHAISTSAQIASVEPSSHDSPMGSFSAERPSSPSTESQPRDSPPVSPRLPSELFSPFHQDGHHSSQDESGSSGETSVVDEARIPLSPRTHSSHASRFTISPRRNLPSGSQHHHPFTPDRSPKRAQKPSLSIPSSSFQTSSTLRAVSRGFRRASSKVVNLDGRNKADYISASDGAVQLRDENDPCEDEDEDDESIRRRIRDTSDEVDKSQKRPWRSNKDGRLASPGIGDGTANSTRRPSFASSASNNSNPAGMTNKAVPKLIGSGPLVGKSLGIFRPDHPLRKACWKVMSNKMTEPIIIVLIITNAVVVVLQGALTSAQAIGMQWEDWCLLALFLIFTLEMFARIIVSGLIFDPFTAHSLAESKSLAPKETTPSSIIPLAAVSSDTRHPNDAPHSNNISNTLPLASPAKETPRNVRFKSGVIKVRAVLALTGTTSEAWKAREEKAMGERKQRAEQEQERADTYEQVEDSDDDEFMFSIMPEIGLDQQSLQRTDGEIGSFGLRNRRSPGTITEEPLPITPTFDIESLPSILPSLGSTTSSQSHQFGSRSASGSTSDTLFLHKSIKSRASTLELPFQDSLKKQRELASFGRPYLRHSWHRIDLLAIISFWIMFGLSASGKEAQPTLHLFIFRALSVLRTGRLLVITRGTATILHSLKRAGPLLVNVAFFVMFSIGIFSIIGVQCFQGSMRRSCYTVNPTNSSDLTTLSHACGGWYDASSNSNKGPVYIDDIDLPIVNFAKGYICPRGQRCIEQYDSVEVGQTFDNILGSMMQVVIIASANSWSSVMYQVMETDYWFACVYFILGIIIINLWFSQLFVAVIANAFSDIRSETKRSAFGATDSNMTGNPADDWNANENKRRQKNNPIMKWYNRTSFVWVVGIILTLAAQATKTEVDPTSYDNRMNIVLLVSAIAFDVEILIRIAGHYPDLKSFFTNAVNDFDLVLALVSTIIEMPGIQKTLAHGWLTIFPLARWYRVILAVPRMKPLLIAVFGHVSGLLNMTLFLVLTILIAAMFALQLFQNDIEQDGQTMITFDQIYNSFIGMYQIFSSENWTEPLYTVLDAEFGYKQGVVSGIFLCLWFMFSNFIMLQLFIAVIQENFAVAEETKKNHQIEAFLRRTEPRRPQDTFLDKFNPYLLFKPKQTIVQRNPGIPVKRSLTDGDFGPTDAGMKQEGMRSFVRNMFGRAAEKSKAEEIALKDLSKGRVDNITPSAQPTGLNRYLDFARSIETTDEAAQAIREKRAYQVEFIAAYPGFDVSLWLFSQSNPIRQFCQSMVPPADGDRLFGRSARPSRTFALKIVMILTVVSGIVVAAVATPIYRRVYYTTHIADRQSWFDLTEIALAWVFILEFMIKVIADGFMFCPNAYLRSTWNCIDFVILICLLANTTTSLMTYGGLSRFTRALKAVRSLRLITLSVRAREILYSVVFAGGGKIIDASMLVLLYMVPYAVWGVNCFSGLLYSCNDSSISSRGECIGEYLATPVDGVGSGFLTPRIWTNPTVDASVWSFDDFQKSILILFEIVSLEGWTDVMASVMNITKINQQPNINASQWNALFFLFYNLFGAVIILTLFVTIIIEAYGKRSGSALLLNDQRQWINLKKTIARQGPAKRPHRRPKSALRSWCFDRAVSKHGWWANMMFASYILHTIIMATNTYDSSKKGSTGALIRNCLFLALSVLYAIDIVIRIYGLGWKSFKDNGWSIFDMVTVCGTFATTAGSIFSSPSGWTYSGQIQKAFLILIILKLVQTSSSLNQLFKTAIVSAPAIGNLFLLWFCFFVFFSIVTLEVFSLTKWSNGETQNANFRDFGNSVVMLAFMSTGEGWNGFMHDYALNYPRCVENENYLDTDCGSTAWSYGIFIAWNVISMYLFVNMFTGIVVESFSYVFQVPGKASLNREEIRAFKKAWALFDPNRTGYIIKEQFIPFFAKLSGVFEVRTYPREASVTNLLPLCQPTADTLESDIIIGKFHTIDVRALRVLLSKIDFTQVRQRKALNVRLYHEAIISEEAGKGISFANMLILLSHYKLIDDEHALLVDELVRRRKHVRKVTESLSTERIRSLFLAIQTRRRYLQYQKETKLALQKQSRSDIPLIVLDSTGATSSPDLEIDPFDTPSPQQLQPFGLNSPISPTLSPLSRQSSYTLSHGFAGSNADLREAQDDGEDDWLIGDIERRGSSPGGWAERLTLSSESLVSMSVFDRNLPPSSPSNSTSMNDVNFCDSQSKTRRP